MSVHKGDPKRSDALVLFGVTGDLAHKMIFPALYAMTKRGVLNEPVVGVAAQKWSLVRLRNHATDSIKQAGKIDDLLDNLGGLAEKMGGGVLVIPAERMPTQAGLAAIYRH